MKIAVYFNLPAGGAKRILYEQVKGLSKKHSIDVYTLTTFKNDFLSLKKCSQNNFVYKFSLNSKLPWFFKRIENDFQNFITLKKVHKKIAKDIDKKNYDLVLVHTDVLTESPFLLRFLKTKTIYYCEELLRIAYEKELALSSNFGFLNQFYESITRNIRKNIDKKNAKYADKILTTSKFIKQKIKKTYNRNATVCYPGVDTNIFKPLNIKKSNQILFLGNKTQIDGYPLVSKALELIPKNIRPKLKILKFSKEGPQIKNDQKLVEEYNKSLLTICTDIREPFGLKVIESMACGTPVIAVNDGGYKETIEDEKTGFLINRNPKELSEQIISLLKNDKKRKLFSNNSVSVVREKWNWQKSIDKLDLLFSTFIKNKSDILISLLDSGGIGGAEFFVIQLSNYLQKKGRSISFITYKKSKILKFLKKNKTEFYTTPFRMDIVGYWKGFIKYIIFFFLTLLHYISFLRSFKQNNGKTVILSGLTDKILISPLAKIFKLKVIWIEYANFEKVLERNFILPKLLYKLSLKYSDHFIVPTSYLKNLLKTKEMYKKKNIKVIPCGIKILSDRKISYYLNNKERIKRRLDIQGKRVIGIVSRLEKGKGQEVLLKSIPHLKKKLNNFVVLIVGEGNSKELKKIVTDLKIQDDVKFLGFYKDRYEIISIFDVFVFPTTWQLEGFGLVSLEAMMMNVPLITSNIPVVKEVVGDAALTIKTTPRNLAKYIVKVLNDKKLKESLVKKGKTRVNNLYNIDKIADKYLKLIN